MKKDLKNKDRGRKERLSLRTQWANDMSWEGWTDGCADDSKAKYSNVCFCCGLKARFEGFIIKNITYQINYF